MIEHSRDWMAEILHPCVFVTFGVTLLKVLGAYLRWTATASNYWSSYGSTNPGSGDGKYYVSIGEATDLCFLEY